VATDEYRYFLRRAAIEAEQALRSRHPGVAAVHRELAAEYRRRLEALDDASGEQP
jgi:hypothetical protein